VVPIVAWPPAARHERDRDTFDLVTPRSDDLDLLRTAVVLLGTRGLDGDHGDAFELEVGFRP